MSAFFVNAVLLIFDVLAGTYILFNEEQPLKAYSSMVFNPLGNITSFRLVQLNILPTKTDINLFRLKKGRTDRL